MRPSLEAVLEKAGASGSMNRTKDSSLPNSPQTGDGTIS